MTALDRTVRRIVVVGGGLAGASAAFAARESGFDGDVTLIGEEKHMPYERPFLSKGYLRGEEPAEKGLVRPASDYEALDVRAITGRRATRLDRAAGEVELADGERIAYDRLVIATGAAPRQLGVPGAGIPGVRYLRTLDDADAIRTGSAERIVVVGGGWIGTEVAASLRQLGRSVTLVTTGALPLEGALGPEIAAVYADLHRSNGVELVMGRVDAVLGDERVTGVHLEDGRTMAADEVIAGVGALPRVELATVAGLGVVDGAVAVDQELQTSDPTIFAAGDVAAALHPRYGARLRVEHWDNAKRQGATAAHNVLGAHEAYARVPYFYSDQFDLGMEFRGRTAGTDEVVVRGDVGARAFLAFWLADGRVVAAMNANVWDAGKELSALVKRGASVDARRLADPAAPLEAIAA